MTFKPTFKTRILLGDFALASKLANCSLPLSVDMLDQTVISDTSKRFLPGVDTSTFTADGFIDADTAADSTAWTSSQPFTYGHEGIALGDRVIMVDALKSSYELGASVSGMSSFTIAGQTDGATDFGVSLHDLTAETIDADGTTYDGTAGSSAGGVGHLHVTAFSGLTSAVVKVQHSTTGSSGWADLISFTSATGVTAERKTVTGTVNRYLRASVDVTGTGSVTFALFFARR